MPPCAAPVWLRVGYSLVSTAVRARGPASTAARMPGAAGADDDDVVAVFDDHFKNSWITRCLRRRSAAHSVPSTSVNNIDSASSVFSQNLVESLRA